MIFGRNEFITMYTYKPLFTCQFIYILHSSIMESFTTNDTSDTLLNPEPSIHQQEIPKSINYSDHSITCQGKHKANYMCITKDCQQSNAFICSDEKCSCQDAHPDDCQLIRLRIIIKKLTQNDKEISRLNQKKRIILNNLIELLQKQINKQDSQLEQKIIRLNVKDEYSLIKFILTNSQFVQNFTPSNASKIYASLMDKKDKPILSQQFIHKIQNFAQAFKKSVENDFDINQSANMLQVQSTSNNNQAQDIQTFELERSRSQGSITEGQSEESEFVFERLSNNQKQRIDQAVQRLDQQVQTQSQNFPRLTHSLQELRIPALRINQNEKETQEEIQSIRNDSLRISELVLGSEAPSAIELELQSLKLKHNNLLNAIGDIKRRQNFTGKYLNMYYPSSSYFHVQPKRECIQIYTSLESLNLAEYE